MVFLSVCAALGPGSRPTTRCSCCTSGALAPLHGGDLQGPGEKQQAVGPECDPSDPGSTGLQELGSSYCLSPGALSWAGGSDGPRAVPPHWARAHVFWEAACGSSLVSVLCSQKGPGHDRAGPSHSPRLRMGVWGRQDMVLAFFSSSFIIGRYTLKFDWFLIPAWAVTSVVPIWEILAVYQELSFNC